MARFNASSRPSGSWGMDTHDSSLPSTERGNPLTGKLPPPPANSPSDRSLPRNYTEEERALLVQLVSDPTFSKVVPFHRRVPDWVRIAEEFSTLTGRILIGAQVKNVYHDWKEQRARAKKRTQRREVAREEQRADLLCSRKEARRRLAQGTGSSLYEEMSPSLAIDTREAGTLGALSKGLQPFTRAEDNRLLELATTARVPSGRNKGLRDWESISFSLTSEFPPGRTTGSYQSRLRKLQGDG